jgi:transposase
VAATERDEGARTAFRAQIADLDPHRIVAIDETSTTIVLTRRYARAPRSQRAYGKVPKNYGIATTLVTALSVDGLGAAMTILGAMTTVAFEIYVRDILAPTLRPGQIVLLDNLAAHKADSIRVAIRARGADVLFLPPYSPDFNLIELAFAKLKAALRAAAARTQEALDTAISATLDLITPAEARGFFNHCGYRSPALS